MTTSLPVRFALFALALVGAVGAGGAHCEAASGVDRLVAATRAALGGSALDRKPILRADETVVQLGLHGTGTQYFEIGGTRFSESLVTGPLQSADGFDGTDVWNADGSGLVWADGGEAGRAAMIDNVFAGNDAAFTRDRGGATIALGAPATDRGVTYDTLVITVPQSPEPFTLWIDRATHLPARAVTVVGAITGTTTYGDYRRVAGIMIPFKVHGETSDGNGGDNVITNVSVDPANGETALHRPPSTEHDFSIANGATSTSVPIELVDNHVYLDVMLDGKGPYRFIFDTGGLNVIDPSIVEELGSSSAGNLQGTGVGSDTASFSFAKVKSLRVGDATFTDQTFVVAPVKAGFALAAGQPAVGLIGFEVLSRMITTFDYAKKRVVFALHRGAAPLAADAAIPFVFNGRQPQFPCVISNVATQCALDTGARDALTLFGPFMAANPSVVPSTLSAPGVTGFGVGGPAFGRLGRLLSLQIGAYTMSDLVGDFTTQTKGAFAVPFVGANVGGDVLKRFTMTLDYQALQMTLVPNDLYGVRDTSEHAGIFILSQGGKKTILDVRAGTPAAAAGLVKGDVIETIDGRAQEGLSLQETRDAFAREPGTALTLGIRSKDGAVKSVVVTLGEYI